MSSVIKSFLAIFLILIAMFSFAGVISVTIDVQNARDYHASVVNEIENSNHAQSVINACKDEATTNGYTLTVTEYSSTSDDSPNTKISKVVLSYSYSIDFLNISSNKEIIGYAR